MTEHIAKPAIEDLLYAINSKSAAKLDWERVKSKSLAISEVGNLQMLRGTRGQPERVAVSESLRDHGKSLFEVAESRDVAVAKSRLEAISENCTNCHRAYR
ncbi:MAG TPA: hypothetical protein DDZ51_12925 [Planctomycetaceae bacterium]|nr:hypothetical protein [Planctomycetaceae bacterium]